MLLHTIYFFDMLYMHCLNSEVDSNNKFGLNHNRAAIRTVVKTNIFI